MAVDLSVNVDVYVYVYVDEREMRGRRESRGSARTAEANSCVG